MNKTVHQKLTNKYSYTHAAEAQLAYVDGVVNPFRQENKMLRQAAQDLLSPRPEAIAKLLELSRSL